MLTDTIPRLVRGRIYHLHHLGSMVIIYDMLGVFLGIKQRFNQRSSVYFREKFYTFKVLAYDKVTPSLISTIDRVDLWLSKHTIEEVDPNDLFMYTNYSFLSDLYKELLADPSINLKVKLMRKHRVAKKLRESRLCGRNRSQ